MAHKDDLLGETLESGEVAQTEEETPQTQREEPASAEPELEEAEGFYEDTEDEAQQVGAQEIFPGGPTNDQVQEWKNLYNDEVYMSDFSGEVLIWRPIRRKEYRDLNRVEGNKDEFFIEEKICSTCVLWPEDYAMHKITFGKAGIPQLLSQLIMERSGFLRPQVNKL